MSEVSAQFPQSVAFEGASERHYVFSDGNEPPLYVLVGVDPPDNPESIEYALGPMTQEQLRLELLDQDLSPQDEARKDRIAPGSTYRIVLDGLRVDGYFPNGFQEFVRKLAGVMMSDQLGVRRT